ncbi:hypothetical protein HK100_007224 [Physocladia obscura]|uniref:tRNA(His) guanylyltransferase n=1 Tax=Physocladia obscura TaxID=109957 RepID=A0AAD5SQZ1_9FUNG|nr:hypothetical protein HK100_007224 [Physocladia obscura]
MNASRSSKIATALAAVASKHTHELGTRLKALEAVAAPPPVAASTPYVIRIDAVGFSVFTTGIAKPFDSRLKDAMVATTIDLVTKFQPIMAYHHSDEISLVYPAAMPAPNDSYSDSGEKIDPSVSIVTEELSKDKRSKRVKTLPDKTHLYSGRIQKLASVVSSYASARLNFHLSTFDWEDCSLKVKERMKGHEAYFDGRVCPLPDLYTAMECIFWRSNFDGFRNSVSGIAQNYFKHSQLQNKNLPQLLEMLSSHHNIDVYEKYGPKYLFGTWIKKEEYTISLDQINLPPEALKHRKSDEPIVRRRFRSGSFNWADYSEEDRVKFLAAKTWPVYQNSPPMDPIKGDSTIYYI